MSANVFNLPTRIDPARLRPEWVACMIVSMAGVVGMDTVRQAQPATAAARRTDLHPIVRTAGDVVAPPEQIAYIDGSFPARIQRVRVLLGANVKEGQPIADLEAPGLDQRLASAEASYQSAVKAYKSASVKLDPAVKSAREAYALAKAKERRASEYAKSSTSVTLASNVETPSTDLDRLAYERAVAGQELWAALQARDEAISGLREHMERTKSDLIAAKRERRNWQVLAPISGTVIRLELEPGTQPTSNASEPAVTIVNLNKLEAKAALPSGAERVVAAGSKATIQIGQLGDKAYHGVVTGVEDLMAERGNVKKQAVIRITDNEGYAKPGMQAAVAFTLPVRKQALVVPVEAVRFGDASRTVVRVVTKKGVEERAVTLGASDGINQEICGGLQSGEVVELTATRQ